MQQQQKLNKEVLLSEHAREKQKYSNKKNAQQRIQDSVSDDKSNSSTIITKFTQASFKEKHRKRKAMPQKAALKTKGKRNPCDSNRLDNSYSNIPSNSNCENKKFSHYKNKNDKETRKNKLSLYYVDLNSFLAHKFPGFDSIYSIVTCQSGSRNLQQLLPRLEDWLIEEIYYSVS